MTNVRPRNGYALPVYIKITDTDGMTVDRNIIQSLNNYTATTDPVKFDDYSAGYGIGSTWINTLTGNIWVCSKDTDGAAEWTNITAPSSYTHIQETADKIWLINHGLNRDTFTYVLFDQSGDQCLPNNISAVDRNTIRVNFSTQMTGKIVIQFV